MDTQAESLHNAPGKKFLHFFFEFFMLFLAVFFGFMAENFREHRVEREREREYMQAFVYDLENDIVNLKDGFPIKDYRLAAIDSVFLYFENNPDATQVPRLVVRNMVRSLWGKYYRRNSTTIDQLKNAGGMRLIHHKNVADSIAAYDHVWLRAEFWRDSYLRDQERGKELLAKLVNPHGLISTYRSNSSGSYLSPSADGQPVKLNPAWLNEYLNFLYYQKQTTIQDKTVHQGIEKSAERLIELLKNEYDFK